MYISHVHIKNIRCFKELKFSLGHPSNPRSNPHKWNLFLGDNSSGKTCLLRCLAIGLCDESGAIALLKELEGNFRRRGTREASEAFIKITLQDEEKNIRDLEVTTHIKPDHGEETVAKRFNNPELYQKIKNNIFLCGYGVQRSGEANRSFRKYSTMEAVYSLFNYESTLQNPEIIVRRLKKSDRETFFRNAEKTFMLKDLLENKNDSVNDYRIYLTREGIKSKGPWGVLLLDEMSDGYWSTFSWLVDMLGWHTYKIGLQSYSAGKIDIEPRDIRGIVLLDELELHLHPTWQRKIANLLRTIFQNVQFISTSHSPLIAANATSLLGEEHSSKIFYLSSDKHGNNISEVEEDLTDLDYGQILSSEAFNYLYNINEDVEYILTEASRLAGKDKRTPKEDEMLTEIKIKLKEIMFPQKRTLIERIIERDYYSEIQEKSKEFLKLLKGIE